MEKIKVEDGGHHVLPDSPKFQLIWAGFERGGEGWNTTTTT
jgi:hypothetical protein